MDKKRMYYIISRVCNLVTGYFECCLRVIGHNTNELLIKIIIKSHEMQMEKQKGVQCVGPMSVHSEYCLRCVGHKTKALLNFRN
jgi:hypothetical protein